MWSCKRGFLRRMFLHAMRGVLHRTFVSTAETSFASHVSVIVNRTALSPTRAYYTPCRSKRMYQDSRVDLILQCKDYLARPLGSSEGSGTWITKVFCRV